MPMENFDHELWARIAGHRFDDPRAKLTFTARLARENGWSIGYSVRVIGEYRRFVFLAMVAGHVVTPSEDVDQVWHLHLVYTRDYWGPFCQEVLGRQLHHGPTLGGMSESTRHDAQYRQTLETYTAAFDTEPPRDIWPDAQQRFGTDLRWRRVNLTRHWVIPKPRRFGFRNNRRT